LSLGTHIGDELRRIRKKKNIKAEDLAKAVDVSQALISNIENGKSVPRINILEKIANHLGVDISELFNSRQIDSNLAKLLTEHKVDDATIEEISSLSIDTKKILIDLLSELTK